MNKPTATPKPVLDEGDFQGSIRNTIASGQHVDYLQGVLRDYETYKKVFDRLFTNKQSTDALYTFRAVYLLKRLVWREFELIGDNTFNDLAEAIIASMGWDNDHMHSFSVAHVEKKSANRDGRRLWAEFFAPGWEDDPFPTYKTDQVHICHIDFKKAPKLNFTFDFGDGHRFDIIYKAVRDRNSKELARDFPRRIDQRGVAPEQYPRL